MSLVADYNSDSEVEDQEEEPQQQLKQTVVSQKPARSAVILFLFLFFLTLMFSPPFPPSTATASTTKPSKPAAEDIRPKEGRLFNPNAFKAISSGKTSVKRFVVDLKFGDDDADEEEDEETKREQERKKRKLLESKERAGANGLVSMLPAPKNSFSHPPKANSTQSTTSASSLPPTPVAATTASFLPYSLQKKDAGQQKGKQVERIGQPPLAPMAAKFGKPLNEEDTGNEDDDEDEDVAQPVVYDKYGNPMTTLPLEQPAAVPQVPALGPQLPEQFLDFNNDESEEEETVPDDEEVCPRLSFFLGSTFLTFPLPSISSSSKKWFPSMEGKSRVPFTSERWTP